MFQRFFFIGVVSVFAIAGFLFFVSPGSTQALSVFDIEYPIPELGNCADRLECKEYCNDLSHKRECLDFARKYQLIEAEDIEEAEQLPETGPGGCEGEEECHAYCEEPSHTEECVRFAVDHGFMDPEEAERILADLNKTGPGGCRGFEECGTYCDDQNHFDECVAFAQSEGFISEKDAELARRVGSEGGPGGCRSHNECRAYCEDAEHIEECLSFAESKGFVSQEEAQRIRKLGVVKGPGGCKFEQCREYCDNPAHETECFEYAVQNGLIPPEEAERVRNLVGKERPGGCRGRQCEEYCEGENHAAECLDFAIANGLVPPEEAERARKFIAVAQEGGPGGCRGRQCEDYCEDSSHQDECFSFAEKNGLIREEDKRDFEVGKKLQKKLEESGGPGGCKTNDECRAYCSNPENTEECVAFAATHGGVPEEQARLMLQRFTEQRFGGPKDFAEAEFRRRFEEQAGRRFEEFKLLEEEFRGPGFQGFHPPGGGSRFGPPEGFGPPGGGFGGPPGGAEGIPGFVGPGGCTSPAECIKFCKEHRDECFGFGPPGQPGARPGEGGVPPGHEGSGRGRGGSGRPSLRSNLIRKFQPEDFPSDFHQLSPEERERIFREKSGFSGEGQERSGRGRESSRVRLIQEKLQGGFNLEIRDPEGIREFRLNPVRGSVYSGGLNCQPDYSSFIQPESSDFPIEATIIDCQDNETTVQLSSPFGSSRDSGESSEERQGKGPKPSEGEFFRREFPSGEFPEGFAPPPSGQVPPGADGRFPEHQDFGSPEDIQRQFEQQIRHQEEQRVFDELRRGEEERIRREEETPIRQEIGVPPQQGGTFNEFFRESLTPPIQETGVVPHVPLQPVSLPALTPAPGEIPPPSLPLSPLPAPTIAPPESFTPPPGETLPGAGGIGLNQFLGTVFRAFMRFVQ